MSKRTVLTFLCFVFAMVGVLQIPKWRRSHVPLLFLDVATVDFGLVRAGEFSESIVEISNHGSANLVISKVVTSCSCSIASIGKSILAPSETTSLVVRVKGSPNPISSAVVQLLTNDPKSPVTSIPLYFRSRSGIWAEPEVLSFGHLDLDQSESKIPVRQFAIKGDLQGGEIVKDLLKVHGDQSFQRAFSYEVFQKQSGDVRISVTPRPNVPCGILTGRLFVSDQVGNNATLTAEAYIACTSKISIVKPLLMRKSSNGVFFGEGAIRLVENFRVKVVSSKIIGEWEPVIDIDSVITGREIVVSCRSSTVHDHQKRFTAEIVLEDESSSKTTVWIPIVVDIDLAQPIDGGVREQENSTDDDSPNREVLYP